MSQAVGNREDMESVIARCEPLYGVVFKGYREACKVACGAFWAVYEPLKACGFESLTAKRVAMERAMAEAVKARNTYCHAHMTDWEWYIENQEGSCK